MPRLRDDTKYLTLPSLLIPLTITHFSIILVDYV